MKTLFTVNAFVLPRGVNFPLEGHETTLEIPRDLPPEHIGECVVEALRRAVREGCNPFSENFCIILSFQKEAVK